MVQKSFWSQKWTLLKPIQAMLIFEAFGSMGKAGKKQADEALAKAKAKAKAKSKAKGKPEAAAKADGEALAAAEAKPKAKPQAKAGGRRTASCRLSAELHELRLAPNQMEPWWVTWWKATCIL